MVVERVHTAVKAVVHLAVTQNYEAILEHSKQKILDAHFCTKVHEWHTIIKY